MPADRPVGFDLTEAGTRKKLSVALVRNSADVPGVARLGIDPLTAEFTPERLGRDPGRSRRSPAQGRASRPEHDRRHRQRVLRRGAACRQDVAVPRSQQARRGRGGDAPRRHRRNASRGAASGPRASRPRSSRARRSRTCGCTDGPGSACPVCGDTVREVSFADSSLQYCPTCQTGGKPLADRRLSKLLK